MGNGCGLAHVLLLFFNTIGITLLGSKVAEQEKSPAFSAKPDPIKDSLVSCLFSALGKEFPGWQKLSFSGS